MQHLSSVGFIFVFSRVTLVAYNKMSMTCHARREISTQTDDKNQPQATSTGQREHPSASLGSPQQKRTVVRRTTRVPSVAHSVVDRLMRPFSKQSSSAYAAAAHAAPVSSAAKAPWPIIPSSGIRVVRRNSAAVSASREIEVKNEIDRTVRATELGTSNGTREAAACICLAAAAAAAASRRALGSYHRREPWAARTSVSHVVGGSISAHERVITKAPTTPCFSIGFSSCGRRSGTRRQTRRA